MTPDDLTSRCPDLETRPLDPTRLDGAHRSFGSLVRRGGGKQRSAASRGSGSGSGPRPRGSWPGGAHAMPSGRNGDMPGWSSERRGEQAERARQRADRHPGSERLARRAERLERRAKRALVAAERAAHARSRIGRGTVAPGNGSLTALACRQAWDPISPAPSGPPLVSGAPGMVRLARGARARRLAAREAPGPSCGPVGFGVGVLVRGVAGGQGRVFGVPGLRQGDREGACPLTTGPSRASGKHRSTRPTPGPRARCCRRARG